MANEKSKNSKFSQINSSIKNVLEKTSDEILNDTTGKYSKVAVNAAKEIKNPSYKQEEKMTTIQFFKRYWKRVLTEGVIATLLVIILIFISKLFGWV